MLRAARIVNQLHSPRNMNSAKACFSSATSTKVLNEKDINANVKNAQYAVRGLLVQLAEKFKAKLADKNHGLPFNEIVFCNIGNPQSVGQLPLTYGRQLMALCLYPDLLLPNNAEHVKKLFPADVYSRAQQIMKQTSGGFGAYSHSKGLSWCRESVAEFIHKRDGIPSDPENIFLSNGASEAISRVLTMLIRNPQDGILIPIPQYPLYTATLALLGGQPVPYYLDESKGWSFDIKDLAASVANAKKAGITPRGMVMINPGNPTGQVLKKSNLKEVITFCHDNRLVLLSDEVYQANIYGETPFVSAKKCMHELGPPYSTNTELFSFHSTSKGFLGECGFRGGYMEAENIDPYVMEQLYKLASISLCSNLPGQLMTSILTRPPVEGEPSYPLYAKERDSILQSLSRRAKLVASSLNGLEGFSCNDAEGAMYLFPSFTLPPKAVAKAQELKLQPDVYYAVQLLEATGLCVVPGSGFGQKDGTWHFRTTFLPPEAQIQAVAIKMKEFHEKFMASHK